MENASRVIVSVKEIKKKEEEERKEHSNEYFGRRGKDKERMPSRKKERMPLVPEIEMPGSRELLSLEFR